MPTRNWVPAYVGVGSDGGNLGNGSDGILIDQGPGDVRGPTTLQ